MDIITLAVAAAQYGLQFGGWFMANYNSPAAIVLSLVTTIFGGSAAYWMVYVNRFRNQLQIDPTMAGAGGAGGHGAGGAGPLTNLKNWMWTVIAAITAICFSMAPLTSLIMTSLWGSIIRYYGMSQILSYGHFSLGAAGIISLFASCLLAHAIKQQWNNIQNKILEGIYHGIKFIFITVVWKTTTTILKYMALNPFLYIVTTAYCCIMSLAGYDYEYENDHHYLWDDDNDRITNEDIDIDNSNEWYDDNQPTIDEDEIYDLVRPQRRSRRLRGLQAIPPMDYAPKYYSYEFY